MATAGNYRTLRARGRTPRTTIDGLIATFCLVNDHELLHNDPQANRTKDYEFLWNFDLFQNVITAAVAD